MCDAISCLMCLLYLLISIIVGLEFGVGGLEFGVGGLEFGVVVFLPRPMEGMG